MWLSRAVPVRIFDVATTFYEWTKVLAYVVTPWQELRDLVMELEFYKEMLSHRSYLIVTNKIDENGADHVM